MASRIVAEDAELLRQLAGVVESRTACLHAPPSWSQMSSSTRRSDRSQGLNGPPGASSYAGYSAVLMLAAVSGRGVRPAA